MQCLDRGTSVCWEFIQNRLINGICVNWENRRGLWIFLGGVNIGFMQEDGDGEV